MKTKYQFIFLFLMAMFAMSPVLQAGQVDNNIGLTEEEQNWLKEHPVIRVISELDYVPFDFQIDGKPFGYSIDYVNLVADKLGIRLEYVTDTWVNLLKMAKNKELDLLHAIMKLPEREKYLHFTRPYKRVLSALITRMDNDEIKTVHDLSQKTVALLKADTLVAHLKQMVPDVKIVTFDKFEPVLKAVAFGKADAAVIDLAVAYYVIKELSLTNLRVIDEADIGRHQERALHFAVRKDWPILVPILEKAMSSLSHEEIKKLEDKWFALPGIKEPHQPVDRVEFTAEEAAFIEQNPVVQVGFDKEWTPIEYMDRQGRHSGISSSYMKLIEKRSGLKFEYPDTENWDDLIRKTKAGEIQILPAALKTQQRSEYLNFTTPYFSTPIIIVSRDEISYISSTSALKGKTIAVVKGYGIQDILLNNHPELTVEPVDSIAEALQKVSQGKAFAYLGNLAVVSYIIKREGLTNLKVAGGTPYRYDLSIAVRKDMPELFSIIQKAQDSITEKQRVDIQDQWISIAYEHKFDYVLIWKILSGTAVLLAVILFWNRRLSREIIKRKQTEEHLKQARDEADAANRAKSAFLANMSHELRTPLNAILGFSAMLSREQKATADQQEKLAIINLSGEHLLAMINDVLDLSKIEAGRAELQQDPFDLVALIEEISTMIQSPAGEKRLSVVVETEKVRFPYVKADVGKLRQILINLLGNAVKFTDEGGVTIRCATEPIPEEPTRCYIVIEVEDTGSGIDLSRRAKIFDPFIQGIDVPVRKGTGLGLSICKAYADLMGGTLEVESELGKGSLFRLRLPAEIDEAADIKLPIDDKPRVIGLAPTQKTWRILIADDNRENLLLLKSLLESVGFFVLEAKNGKEAVEAFKKESLDLIWMDMRMPIMNGYEAVRQIRQCSGDDTIPIIAITASAFREHRHDILAPGCDDMVIKPFQTHEIFEVMGRFLDIEYIYEAVGEAAPVRVPEIELTAAMLADLPEGLLQELRETTLALDMEVILEVINRVEAHAPETAQQLRALVQNFQTQRIREVLKKVEDKE